jgi:hypothetical protein
MRRDRREARSRKDEFKPTTAETAGNVQFLARYVIGKITWPVWAMLIALPAAGYFAYPYYQQWAVWDSTFETQVYNMSDEKLVGPRSERYDYQVRIGVPGVFPSDMTDGTEDFTNSRKVTFFWSFETTDHGHKTIDDITRRTCYFKALKLPERKKGQDYLMIGVYDKDVLRIRWSSNGDIGGGVGLHKYSASEAWQHGSVPLSSNWRKNDPTNWPEKTTWNEAVDGPAIDAQGAGAWLTAKADRAEPCKENE